MWGSAPKKQPTPQDLLRNSKRQVTRSQRDIEREIKQLERQEKQIAADIKKLAAQGQMSSARLLAKQIVQIRNQRERMFKSKATLNTVSTQTSAAKANLAMTTAMSGATKAMQTTNAASNLTSTMAEFARQSEMMNMNEEMLDDLLDDSDEEDDAQEIVDSVFDEIGLEVGEKLISAPKGAIKSKAQAQELSAAEEAEADELLKQLA